MNQYAMQDPTKQYPQPKFEKQSQSAPGLAQDMDPKPDHGETSYQGFGRLAGRRAVITGANSGIGRAVATAFAREGADIALNYLASDERDAQQALGGIDILVNVAGKQTAVKDIADLTTEQFDATFRTNVYAMFWLCKAALPHMPPGATIINTTSIQGYQPSPPCSTTPRPRRPSPPSPTPSPSRSQASSFVTGEIYGVTGGNHLP